MSLIPVAAPLIRLAATDTEYAQDLRDAVFADDQTLGGLVRTEVREGDLAELTSSEWQWYASWRQELDGGLDRTVLDHLTASASTRFARFEVRELVLRDPGTIALAPPPDDLPAGEDAIGLNWLSKQAKGARIIEDFDLIPDGALPEVFEQIPDEVFELMRDEALELMDDALQCATEASWFLLRRLTALNDDRGRSVNGQLREFAGERDIESRIRERWGLREPLER